MGIEVVISDPETRRKYVLKFKEEHKLTQKEIAKTLSENTGDPVGVRTVESWLCNPKARHHRPCPGWVVFVLRSVLSSG